MPLRTLLLASVALSGCALKHAPATWTAQTGCAPSTQVERQLRKAPAEWKPYLNTLMDGRALSTAAAPTAPTPAPPDLSLVLTELATCQFQRASGLSKVDVLLAGHAIGTPPSLDVSSRDALIVAITDDQSLDATRRYRMGLALIASIGWTGERGADLMWAARQTLSLAGDLALSSTQAERDVLGALDAGVRSGRLMAGSRDQAVKRLTTHVKVPYPEPGCGPAARVRMDSVIETAADFSFFANLLPTDHPDRVAHEADKSGLAELAAFVSLTCAVR
ncbi:MAG: hypothetical protein ACI9MC_003027 [Kiritimatiellia bacterium]|jgi:hypothetical protein